MLWPMITKQFRGPLVTLFALDATASGHWVSKSLLVSYLGHSILFCGESQEALTTYRTLINKFFSILPRKYRERRKNKDADQQFQKSRFTNFVFASCIPHFCTSAGSATHLTKTLYRSLLTKSTKYTVWTDSCCKHVSLYMPVLNKLK